MKKNKLKFSFELFMILKTITLICFVFALLILLSPFFLYLEERDINIFPIYYNAIINLFIKRYFIILLLFIGAFLFVFLFLMRKLKEPNL